MDGIHGELKHLKGCTLHKWQFQTDNCAGQRSQLQTSNRPCSLSLIKENQRMWTMQSRAVIKTSHQDGSAYAVGHLEPLSPRPSSNGCSFASCLRSRSQKAQRCLAEIARAMRYRTSRHPNHPAHTGSRNCMTTLACPWRSPGSHGNQLHSSDSLMRQRPPRTNFVFHFLHLSAAMCFCHESYRSHLEQVAAPMAQQLLQPPRDAPQASLAAAPRRVSAAFLRRRSPSCCWDCLQDSQPSALLCLLIAAYEVRPLVNGVEIPAMQRGAPLKRAGGRQLTLGHQLTLVTQPSDPSEPARIESHQHRTAEALLASHPATPAHSVREGCGTGRLGRASPPADAEDHS